MNASFHKVAIDSDRSTVKYFESDEDRGAFYAIDLVLRENAGREFEGLSAITLYVNADTIGDLHAALGKLQGDIRRAAGWEPTEEELVAPF